MIAPSFSEYEEALRSVGAEVEYYYLCEEDNFQIRGDYVDKLFGRNRYDNFCVIRIIQPDRPLTGIC